MLLERSRVTSCNNRTILLIIMLSVLVFSGCAHIVRAESGYDPTGDIDLTKMNFHMYSPVYSNSNFSIFVYNGAETNPPTYASPVTSVIFCDLHQTVQTWLPVSDVWFGVVTWITQPLAENMTIQGNVSMTVWMSTPDEAPALSGYALGLSEVDSLGNPIGESSYQYYYAYGNVLGRSPAPFKLSFDVNRTVTKGHIIGFFVVVGATTQGWRYQVYFDSPNMNSFAELPILSVPIPEFSQAMGVIIMTMILVSLCVVKRSRKKPLASTD
ncbi:MAG: hypothetical protein WCC94_00885 [Candidatus Bathyarchaeia archaeon]